MYVSSANNLTAVLWSSISITCCIWSDWSFSVTAMFGKALHLKHQILSPLVAALKPDLDLMLLLSSLLKFAENCLSLDLLLLLSNLLEFLKLPLYLPLKFLFWCFLLQNFVHIEVNLSRVILKIYLYCLT